MRCQRFAWVLISAGVMVLASVSPQAASSGNQGNPGGRGSWKCWADSPSHKVRLWWSEVRGSEHTIPDVIEKPSTASVGVYTPPRTDGRCATHPEIVRHLGGRIDALLRRDRVLGLPAPASDIGMPAHFGDPSHSASGVADGGSSALDVYLDAGSFPLGGGDGGTVTCNHWLPRGRANAPARSAGYVTLYGVRTVNQQELDRLVFNAAHELVHVSQCALTNRSGSVNGTTIDLWMVEGSANAFALASSGLIDDRNLALALRRPQPVLVSQSRSAEPTMYAQFPFWYKLFGAPSARRYTAFLRAAIAASPAEHRHGDASLVYRTFGETAVQRALLQFASFAVLGGELGGVHYNAGRLVFEDPDTLAHVTPSAAAPAHAQVRLKRGSYGYLVLTWPQGATDLTITTAGVPAARAESQSASARERAAPPVRQTARGTFTATATPRDTATPTAPRTSRSRTAATPPSRSPSRSLPSRASAPSVWSSLTSRLWSRLRRRPSGVITNTRARD